MKEECVRLIAVAGGIGSGKSVVSAVLRAMGYSVYDCDSECRRLMDGNVAILEAIAEGVCCEAVYVDKAGVLRLDRKLLAETVFNDAEKLRSLNTIVHSAVKDDIRNWCRKMKAEGKVKNGELFVETAILTESGLHNMVDEVWEVKAPEEVRLSRAMKRDGVEASAVKSRMQHQRSLPSPLENDRGRAVPVSEIINDNHRAVVPQILNLL